MKKIICIVFLYFTTIVMWSQTVKLQFDEWKPVPKEWKMITWSILDEIDGEITAYATTGNSNENIQFVRFDRNFNIIASTKTKTKYVSDIITIRRNDSVIDAVVNTHHYVYDAQTLEQKKNEELFNLSGGGGVAHIKAEWSDNGEYVAFLVKRNGQANAMATKTRNYCSVHVYDRHFNKLSEQILIDNIQSSYKNAEQRFSADIAMCNNGEALVAAYAEPVDGGEMNFSTTFYGKDGSRRIDFGSCGLKASSNNNARLLSFDGDRVVMLVSNNICTYKLSDKSQSYIGELTRFDENKPVFSNLVSYDNINVTNTNEGGCILSTGRYFHWVEPDGKDKPLSWGKSYENYTNKIFKIDSKKQTQELSFYFDGWYYGLDFVTRSKSNKSKDNECRLFLKRFNRLGEYSEQIVETDVAGLMSFCSQAPGRYLVWQQQVKMGKDMVQRLGIFEVK